MPEPTDEIPECSFCSKKATFRCIGCDDLVCSLECLEKSEHNDSSLCGFCFGHAKIRCIGCGKMPYCSVECLENDKDKHRVFCSSFTNCQDRLGPNYYRGIFFPWRTSQPEFVWLKHDAGDLSFSISKHELAAYGLENNRTKLITSDVFAIADFTQSLRIIWHESIHNDTRYINQSIKSFAGEHSSRSFCGPILVVGLDEQDVQMERPVDLDTTCIPGLFEYIEHSKQARAANNAEEI